MPVPGVAPDAIAVPSQVALGTKWCHVEALEPRKQGSRTLV